MPTHVIEDKTHARLSPSASKRWMVCPGSVRLIESLDLPETFNRYAAEGTVAHEIHELALLAKGIAADHIGKKMTVDGFKFTVTEPMAEAVQVSLDYVQERIDEHEGWGYRVELKVEVRASLKPLGIPGLDGGTSDVVLLVWDGDTLVEIEVIDYKHGQGVAVEPEHNTQALCYALGVALEESTHITDQTNVRVTITQPRAIHTRGPIRTWEITALDLNYWQFNELVPKANRTRDPDAELVPSDDGCRFCQAAGQCPALYKKTQEVAIADFAEDKFPDPETMTSQQKKVVMEHAGMLRSFIVAVENQVKLEMDHGSKDYDNEYKLVYKTVHRKFTEEGLDENFSPLYDYLEPEELYEQKLRPLGDIEKALKSHMKPKEAKEVMNEVTEKPTPGIVVAPIEDKRKAVEPTMISDFTNLPD
jgi:hypothetical protein